MAGYLQEHNTAAIVVPAPLAALQALAKAHMERNSNVFRIGITGSNGKTTTKEILGSILRQSNNVFVNEGNINSEIGVPLSAFQVDSQLSHSVFEMAMNRRGEMDILASVVKPDLALITNIGVAHMGLLGTLAVIAEEKKKIFRYFNGNQTAFIFENEPYFNFLTTGVRGTILKFGPLNTPGYQGSESLGLDGNIIHWEGTQIRFPYPGNHNVTNALGAISLAMRLGVTGKDIKNGVEHVKPLFGRSQILRGPVTVILDCYNSSTESVVTIFSYMRSLLWPGRKIAVLGSMLELGSASVSEHTKILQNPLLAQFDTIFLLGEEFHIPHKRVRRRKIFKKLTLAESTEDLVGSLKRIIKEGDLVLLKASRGVEMEKILPSIIASREMIVAGRDYGP